MNQSINDIELALDSLKPKVFWKDRPIYVQQLNRWNIEMLNRALNIVGKTELMMKKNSLIRSDLLIKKLLINLCDKFISHF